MSGNFARVRSPIFLITKEVNGEVGPAVLVTEGLEAFLTYQHRELAELFVEQAPEGIYGIREVNFATLRSLLLSKPRVKLVAWNDTANSRQRVLFQADGILGPSGDTE